MKRYWMRLTAMILALLLVAGYFLLPMENYENIEVNGGRKKAGIAAGESLSWAWTPHLAQPEQITLELSGVKKAQGLTLQAEITDGAGNQVSSLTQKIADLGEETRMSMKGSFRQGTAYTLTIRAEGEGSIKIRGDENENGEFLPGITESGVVRTTNPTLLYFAAGLLLLALTPVFGTGRAGEKRRGFVIPKTVNGLLPILTFLMILVLGLIIIFSKPAFVAEGKWGVWDEETHLEGVQNICLAGGRSLQSVLGNLSLYSAGYVPLAIGYTAGSLFTADYEALYHIAVTFGMVTYALMAALAVAHAPKYKASFMAASVLAVNLHLMTSFHYDTVVIGSILLGMALLLEALDQEGPLSAGRAMALCGLLAFGTVCKPAYSVVLLALLMIPSARLGGKGKAWMFRGFVILLVVWCGVAAIIPGPYDSMRGGDSRYSDVDAAAQLAGMQANPFGAVGKLFGFFFGQLEYMLVLGIGNWAYFGIVNWVPWVLLGLLLLIAPLCSGGEDGKSLLTPGRRITLAAVALGAEMILLTIQYVVSSPVGGELVGMQPRYIVPVWICLALALMLPRGIRSITKKASDVLTLGVYVGCFGVNLWYVLHWIQAAAAV